MNQPMYKTGRQVKEFSDVILFFMFIFYLVCGVGLTLLAFFCAFVSFYDGYSIIVILFEFIFIMSVAVFIFLLGWADFSRDLARYHFTELGVEVKWPLRSSKLVSWDEFQQVCVCFAEYSTRGEPRAKTVICCVKIGEKKNWYGRWKADNSFRYRSVFVIDYSPELHEGIKERCPYDVIDLRETRAYKLY